MKRILVLLAVGALLLGIGCVRELRHDPSRAAAAATEFIQALVIEQDAQTAFDMTDPASRNGRTAADLDEAVSGAPGYGDVTSVEATEYEPVPGQAAVGIYLEAQASGVTYYYYVQVAGTMDDGYRPAHFTISKEPFPASDLREPL